MGMSEEEAVQSLPQENWVKKSEKNTVWGIELFVTSRDVSEAGSHGNHFI